MQRVQPLSLHCGDFKRGEMELQTKAEICTCGFTQESQVFQELEGVGMVTATRVKSETKQSLKGRQNKRHHL